MKTVGYAIVGTGYFGAELGRIMKTKEGAKIVAVYDPENGAAIAAELGCDNESSLESICARPDVDAVIVATPNYLHKEPVLEAARNHKNVFCEKPIALSYADCDEMVNTSKENNVVFMAGHVMNFFHGVRLAKKFIQEGRIGKVLYAALWRGDVNCGLISSIVKTGYYAHKYGFCTAFSGCGVYKQHKFFH